MSLTVQAIYEGGVLKLTQPLPFKEHEKVRVTIEPEQSLAEATAGIVPWKGSHESLERILAENVEAETAP